MKPQCTLPTIRLALLALVLLLFGAQQAHTGTDMIPLDRRILWRPGIPGGIPEVPIAANVRDFGAKGDGLNDDAPAFRNAIRTTTSGAILIPAGTYLLKSRLTIDRSVVLRGEGADKTHLIIDHNEDPAVEIAKYARGPYVLLNGGYTRGSTELIVTDSTPFRPGVFIEIQQDNDPSVMYTRPEWNQDWAQNAVGQLAKVVTVSKNTITIDEPLRVDMQARLNPRMRSHVFVEYAGIERLHLTRRDRSFTHLVVLNPENSRSGQF